MSKLAFVDTHVHFWDLQHPDLHYALLQPESEHPQMRHHWEKVKSSNYLADDFIAETRSANVTKVVFVQAALGIDDPVKETEWLQAEGERTGYPQAIVAYSELKGPRVEEELERHCQHSRMRGIRDFYAADVLGEPAFQRGYALLEKFDLVASINAEYQHMEALRDLAGKFPNIHAVVDHAGFPKSRTDDYFQGWRKGMSTAAEAENVICKISGLGMVDWDWTVESIRPWVMHCIDAFGPERCIFATNWPVDKAFSTYDELIDAYTRIIVDFTDDEKVAMFSGNAERLYRI
jgi:predicted TIM-barrel fold metal-dependent hydrolase